MIDYEYLTYDTLICLRDYGNTGAKIELKRRGAQGLHSEPEVVSYYAWLSFF